MPARPHLHGGLSVTGVQTASTKPHTALWPLRSVQLSQGSLCVAVATLALLHPGWGMAPQRTLTQKSLFGDVSGWLGPAPRSRPTPNTPTNAPTHPHVGRPSNARN